MTQNPYAAPSAAVADVTPDETLPPLHRHVLLACRLLWASVVMGGLSLLISLFTNNGIRDGSVSPAGAIGGLLFGGVFMVGIVFWFTLKLQAGRNWMRLLVTILNVGGLIIMAATMAFITPLLAETGAESMFGPVDIAFDVINSILTLAVVVLINTPGARAWFAAMKRSAY